MKKKLLAGLLASSAIAGLASCDEVSLVSKIELSNQDSVATFGETFADSDLVVTATMADGTTKDVTAEANVDTTKVDTSKAGVYAVVVSYEGQSAVYYVTVKAPAPAATVSSISVSGQNTNFKVGDTYAKGNVAVTATLSDGTTKDVSTSAKVDASKVDTTKAGVYAVVVSYEGVYATYYVTVAEKEAPVVVTVSSIAVTGQKLNFTVGDTFTKGNVKVTATMSDESTEDVTTSAKVDTTKVDTTKAGVYAVIVTYENCLATYYVTVSEPVVIPEATATSIVVTGQTTEFTVDDTFTNGNLVVTATMSDSTTKVVTTSAKVDASNVNTAKAGVYAVLVTYEGCSAIYYVTVSEAPKCTSIAVSGQKTTFNHNDVFVTGSLVVTATMSDSTTKDVTANAKVDSSKVNTAIPGTYAVVVSYEGCVATYYVTVNEPNPEATLKGVTLSGQNTELTVGEEYEVGDLVVTALYSDESEVDVTADVAVDTSKVDTTKAGTYPVIVKYNVYTEIYYVTVNPLPAITSVALSEEVVTEIYVNDYYDIESISLTVNYDDETSKEVSYSELEIDDSNLNVSVPGVYTILVSYEGVVTYFNVTVNPYENEKTLIDVVLDLKKTKTGYVPGQTVSVEDVVVYGYYENTEYPVTYEKVDSSEITLVSVKNSADETVETLVDGKYTVTILIGEEEYSYEIKVYEPTATMIAEGVANASKVNGGQVIENPGEYQEEYNFTLGNNYFTYSDSYGVEYHYSLNEDELFGVQTSEYGKSLAPEETNGILNGYKFNILSYTKTVYGVTELITSLYEKGSTQKMSESVKDGVYTFSYPLTIEDEWGDKYYLVISTSFSIGEKGEFNFAEVSQTYCYDVVEAEDGSWTYDEENTYSSVIQINQTTGERNAVNQYSADNVLLKSFDLVDSEGNELPEEFNILAGESVILKFDNVVPRTAIPSLSELYCECDSFIFADIYEDYIEIPVYSAGTYEITLYVGEIEKQIKIVATQPQPQSINIQASELVQGWWGEGYEMVETSNATVNLGETLYVGANINPSQADQEVTISLKEAYTGVTLSEVDGFDYNAPYFEGTMMCFNATAVGTYVVVFTSVIDETITGELTVEVKEGSSSEETATFEGTWTAYHPINPMVTLATIEVGKDYAQFSDGMSASIMMTYELDGTTVLFTVPGVNSGNLSISNATVNADYTEMTALVVFMGQEMELTFTK